ncbi:hypothetical protein RHSIM_Rhsim04G0083200 [Rhododendron simsii]|uniref:Uncharacterized protein n=1 Tax=Rhododendron simsii TaxID=118357 RepID=A0A834HDR2_RHOSS|nr:hypothetical protein RHSIM_Rhsim04G0083200 [Rhododendron simsii]
MKTTATVELVFIPSPGMGHLVSAVEMAKQLVGRDDRLSITVLIMKRPFDKSKVSSSTQSLLLTAAEDRLKFVYLPLDEAAAAAAELQSKFPDNFMLEFIKMNKQHVRDHVRTMVSTGSTRIAGFVLDLFCTPMMDVAFKFGVPSYAFFTSNATVLGLAFHLESLSPDEYHDLTELKDSDAELEVPGFVNSVPIKVLPASFRNKEVGSRLMSIAKRLRQTKGIMVNTFEELESNAVRFLAENDNNKNEEATEIVKRLDNQPLSAVVLLCFGSMGSFGGDQLKEIAQALEQSGHRFLWSVRRPPSKGKREIPGEYQELNQVLPDGFLGRTNEIGKVIGWALQVAIQSHKAVGARVRVALWTELNTGELMVLSAGGHLADACRINVMLVTAEEIENGIRKLMESKNECGEERKKRVKEMSEKSKIAVRLRQTKGIMVNTFEELESNAVRFLAENDKAQPVYPVGPVIHLVNNKNEEDEEATEIVKWLDNQPLSSVVFLCFGSMGCFGGDQLKEIAQAIERSGHRFLWSVRQPPSKVKGGIPGEYQDLNQVLPQGFLECTKKIGKVIGWAPQVAILSHKAVGGFVSHCGWNSTLESLWCGVPVATWPMHAEQQTNAFQLVRELRLAVDIKLDYKKDIYMSDSSNVMLVTTEEIDNGIR